MWENLEYTLRSIQQSSLTDWVQRSKQNKTDRIFKLEFQSFLLTTWVYGNDIYCGGYVAFWQCYFSGKKDYSIEKLSNTAGYMISDLDGPQLEITFGNH